MPKSAYIPIPKPFDKAQQQQWERIIQLANQDRSEAYQALEVLGRELQVQRVNILPEGFLCLSSALALWKHTELLLQKPTTA